MNLADPIFTTDVALVVASIAAGPIRGARRTTGGRSTAALLFLILLAGLIVYGSTHLTNTASLTTTASHETISPNP